MSDTYTVLRHFADSWWLLGMLTFFLGAVAFAFRPGTKALHKDIAGIPLRDDDLSRLEEDAPLPAPVADADKER